MLHLKQLPDHCRFQNSADTAGRYDESIRREHEVMQPCEESLVLECQLDKRINFLLKRKINANAHRLMPITRKFHPLISRLHQPRTTAGDDVATEFSQGF